MNPISAATDLELSDQLNAEEARRKWVASLKPNDEVEVAYSHQLGDIYKMRVLKTDGAKLSLLTVGMRNRPQNWVTACAINGWLLPNMMHLLVPPGTTKPFGVDPDGPDVEHLMALQRYANENGRYWKRELSAAWSNGRDEREPDAAFLRGVRNGFGPEWLYSKRNPIRPQEVRK